MTENYSKTHTVSLRDSDEKLRVSVSNESVGLEFRIGNHLPSVSIFTLAKAEGLRLARMILAAEAEFQILEGNKS